MKLQTYILPFFVSANILAQDDKNVFPKINFGITHSTFTAMSFQSTHAKSITNNDLHITPHSTTITETQYGFGVGLFMWMPLNEGVIFKPKIEGSFSNSCIKQSPCIFATSFDLSVSHGFVIALTKPNSDGIIYAARNMTCYLTSKQPYVLIGPKINLKKYDEGYIQKGFQNELVFGFFIGYGINYIFQGKNFAPEICYTINATSQNSINHAQKTMHTISVAVNFF